MLHSASYTPPPTPAISPAFMLSGCSVQLAHQTLFFSYEIKTILNANDLNKISEVGSPLPVNYHTQ